MFSNPTSIKFAPDLVPLIKNGSKTLTYRLGNKYEFLKVGDVINLADNSSVDFAEAVITEKSKAVFGELPLDRAGHEAYASEEEKTKRFEALYSRKVEPTEEVIVLGYKVTKYLSQ